MVISLTSIFVHQVSPERGFLLSWVRHPRENGVARVRCTGYGHDFFVAFSCLALGVCPNCTSKRSLLFGEKVLEIVHPLNHRHVTFTIPKLLRGYLRRIRRLGKLLLRSAWEAWQEYLHELLQIRDGLSAA